METYVIRRALVIPLGIVLLLCCALAGVVVVQHQPVVKLLVLGSAILPLGFLFCTCTFRRIESDPLGLRLILYGKTRRAFAWSEITAVETVQVRQRAFVTISAGEEFIIVPNLYARFDRLLAALQERLPAAVVSEETRAMAQAPPVKHSDLVLLWGLAALLVWLISVQFIR